MALEKALSSLVPGPIGYGVYIHWPYCSKICSYCNFNKYRLPTNNNDHRLHQYMEKQLSHFLHKAQYPRVTSMYFGGGTPSLASSTMIAPMIDLVKTEVGLVNGAEVTLEVNPSVNVLDKLDDFKQAGVNRVSIGVQSLNDDILKNVLYRDHTASNAKTVIAKASKLFNGAINIDFMFGLPNQIKKEFLDNVTEIVEIFPTVNHVSLNQLTLERGTVMFKHVKNGKWTLPVEDSVINCYQEVIELLKVRGFTQYEISNFARTGYESRHNQNYWLGGNYIGVGPGAHSCYLNPLDKTKWIKCVGMLSPRRWMDDVDTGNGLVSEKSISCHERFEEILCSSLRTNCGFDKRICQSLGVVYEDVVDLCNCSSKLRQLLCDGYVSIGRGSLKATDKGTMILDTVLATFLAELDNYDFYHAQK